MKGVAKVWQLTAVDTTTRRAICDVFLGPSNTEIAKRFLDRVIRKLRRLGVHVTGVLTDNGPELSTPFDAHLETLEITHHRTPTRSPNHNPVCELARDATVDYAPWASSLAMRSTPSTRASSASANESRA